MRMRFIVELYQSRTLCAASIANFRSFCVSRQSVSHFRAFAVVLCSARACIGAGIAVLREKVTDLEWHRPDSLTRMIANPRDKPGDPLSARWVPVEVRPLSELVHELDDAVPGRRVEDHAPRWGWRRVPRTPHPSHSASGSCGGRSSGGMQTVDTGPPLSRLVAGE